MSKLAKALQAAAGNSAPAGELANAIDFDGVSDYLSRSTDLVGNTDSNVLTFSAWVYRASASAVYIYQADDDGVGSASVEITATSTNFTIVLRDSSRTNLLDATVNMGAPQSTFTHLVFSVNLANTAQRRVYVNDVAAGTIWSTYTNGSPDFTVSRHVVGARSDFVKTKSRLSNVYLDYTYRDLSNPTNRRLFITEDLKPADGQASLNPILYLPLDDPEDIGYNAGTGGNFTVNGVMARSGRGPNQYNAPYSDLDGTSDFLEKTSALTGLADGKVFTFQCVFNTDVTTIGKTIFTIANNTTARFYLQLSSGPGIHMDAYNSSGTRILESQIRLPGFTSFVPGKNYVLTVSIDMANTANRHVYVNGQAASMNWNTYTNNDIDFLTATPRCYVGQSSSNALRWNGDLGAVWFDTSYIDLSNPDNLAKFVTDTGKPVDPGANGELPTGTSPIIYLPMYGNNAGKNYGTGGDFTATSGPYAGARGPNEFWARSMRGNGTTGYLSRGSLTGIADGQQLTIAVASYTGSTNTVRNIFKIATGATQGLWLRLEDDQEHSLTVYNTANGTQADISNLGNQTSNIWRVLLFTINTALTNKQIQVWDSENKIVVSTPAGTPGTMNLDLDCTIGATNNPNDIAFLYVSDQLVDFSQEANRLKFVDAFGYPIDLQPAIDAGDIPSPLVYMKFDDPSALGTNSGTGGDFTVNGTVTQGADVSL